MVNIWYILLSVGMLAIMLACVVLKPSKLPEGLVGVVCALVLVLSGATTMRSAGENIRQLLPTVLFLGLCMIFAQLCQREGLFSYLGSLVSDVAAGNASLLFVFVVILSSIVTAALSLDTTVLLLTPVILQTAVLAKVNYRPYVYATGHLANTASLLLPVSNLTNLLALQQTHITFMDFLRMMALPWTIAVILEYLVLRVVFRRQLSPVVTHNRADDDECVSVGHVARPQMPKLAVMTVTLTLLGFIVAGGLDLAPFWVAAGGCVILIVGRRIRSGSGRLIELPGLWKASNPSFLLFVLALAVVVSSLARNGVDSWMRPLFSQPTSLVSLLVIAAVAAVIANVINNLPAAMLLIPLAAAHSPVMAMAVLIGVNIGPNLSYAGSLATILWRRLLHGAGKTVSLARFTWIGMLTVPVCMCGAVLALWWQPW